MHFSKFPITLVGAMVWEVDFAMTMGKKPAFVYFSSVDSAVRIFDGVDIFFFIYLNSGLTYSFLSIYFLCFLQ